jgi:hypothetical protein
MAAASGPLCPIRAQVPLAEALSQHAQHDSGLAFALFIPYSEPGPSFPQ